MMRSGFLRHPLIAGWIALVVVSIFLAPCGGLVFPFEFVLYMTFGWIGYLANVIPKIRPDWSAAILAAAALTAFTGGLHWFLVWFRATVPPQSGSMPPAWNVRWTLSTVAIVIMSFVAGISMVGITHQLGWLFAGPDQVIDSEMIAARRMQSFNNMKQMWLGVLGYEKTNKSLPPGMFVSSNGGALHGWQTMLLPYIEQKQLFETIDLQTAWNADKHRKVFSTPVPPYALPTRRVPKNDSQGYALTHYSANSHVISGTRQLTIRSITDGTSNTILAGEVAGNYKPWGHPQNWRDPAMGINASPQGFGNPWPIGGSQFVFIDGHTQLLSAKTDPKILRALATPAGGEPIPDY